VLQPFALWPCIAGPAVLLLGIVSARKELAAASGADKLVILAPTFVAAPLAVFGAEHLAGGPILAGLVPRWIPAPLFWAYFVGVALIAAALSLSLKRYVRWSAPLLALMIFIFVLTIHVPGVFAHPHDRIFWTVMFRDTSFAGGALILAGAVRRPPNPTMILLGRLSIAIALLLFGVEHFLHPANAPGVPLAKMTPAWVPLPAAWAFLVGLVCLFDGANLLINRRSKQAAIEVGFVMTFLTLFLYLPILLMDRGTNQVVEGVNYVADTLMYAGTVLLVAWAIRPETRDQDGSSYTGRIEQHSAREKPLHPTP
jgi:uncharacterized membrane protein